jgi:hypothetical protein
MLTPATSIPDECFYGGTHFTLRITKRTNKVFAYNGWNNKYFGIMDDERFKYISFHQADNIYYPLSAVLHLF